MSVKPYFKVKILKLKCTQFDFGLQRSPDPLVGGLLLRGGEGRKVEGKGQEEKGTRGASK